MAKIVNAFASAEGLLHVFEWLSVGAGILAVAALIGIALTSRTLSRQNKTAFQELKGNVAKQQEEASNAKAAQQRVEIDLANARTDLSKALTNQAQTELALEKLRAHQGQRVIKSDIFEKSLLGKPKATIVDIWYQPDNGEAFVLALSAYWELRNAGWNVLQQPTPIPTPPNNKEPTLPLSLMVGGSVAGE